jgi:hypothetical protein
MNIGCMGRAALDVVCELHPVACGQAATQASVSGGFMFRRHQSAATPWAVAAGAAAGAGALAFAVLSGVRAFRNRRHAYDPGLPAELDALEDAAVEVLRRDAETGVCAIDVAAIAPGIIELTGMVPAPGTAQRAARLLHSLSAVRTVISRLEVGTSEERLAASRARQAQGDPQFRERQWYGVRVGTGRRRQSSATEPARPDDSLQRRTRALELPSQPGDTDNTSPPSSAGTDSRRAM